MPFKICQHLRADGQKCHRENAADYFVRCVEVSVCRLLDNLYHLGQFSMKFISLDGAILGDRSTAVFVRH
jgi:hypothetical protein